MRRRNYLHHCLAAAILIASAAQASQAADSTAAEDAIRSTAREFTEAFNNGNAKAVAALWTPDGEYSIGRQSLKGREAIANVYGEYFRTHPGAKMAVKIESI